jgi:hypothetical protein
MHKEGKVGEKLRKKDKINTPMENTKTTNTALDGEDEDGSLRDLLAKWVRLARVVLRSTFYTFPFFLPLCRPSRFAAQLQTSVWFGFILILSLPSTNRLF